MKGENESDLPVEKVVLGSESGARGKRARDVRQRRVAAPTGRLRPRGATPRRSSGC